MLQRTWKVSLGSGLRTAAVRRSALPVLVEVNGALCSAAARPWRELSPQSLAEMGFSETQAEVLHENAKKNRCKGGAEILGGLLALGLNPASIVKLLEKCPELHSVQESQLRTRVATLRKLGLVEGESHVLFVCTWCLLPQPLLWCSSSLPSVLLVLRGSHCCLREVRD